MKLLHSSFVGIWLVIFCCNLPAQLITPVEGSNESVNREAAAKESKRAPVFAAKWPFKFGKGLFSKQDAKDPFLQGAVAQQQLAKQIATQSGIQTPSATGTAPTALPNNLAPPQSYPWPAPVGSGTHAVVPSSASSQTTWNATPVEANAGGQLASKGQHLNGQPSAVVAQASATTESTGGFLPAGSVNTASATAVAAPPTQVANDTPAGSESRPFSHFVASNADNPPPPAMPLASFASPSKSVELGETPAPGRPHSNLVASQATTPATFDSTSNVTAAAELPAQTTIDTAKPADIATSATLVAGAPSQPPQQSAPDFSVQRMDQNIWGTNLSAPTRSATNTSELTRNEVAAGVKPLENATGDRVVSRDDDFAADIRQSNASPSYIANNNSKQGVAPKQTSASMNIPASNNSVPFDRGPSVALLDSPVVANNVNPVQGSGVVHGSVDEGTRVLAIVGNQSILAGDLLGYVNEMLAPYKGQAPDAEINAQREKIMAELLPKIVERKLIVFDFLKKIPPEKVPEIEQEVFKHFNDNRLPEILKKSNLRSPAELDAKLRALGSSLANQQRMYFEQMISAEAVHRQVKKDSEVSHEEMLSYYNKRRDAYSFPAKVRWQRIAVDPSRFNIPQEAYNAVARLGNEVFHGADFAEVARRGSHGPRAASGGEYDWTTQGSLKNKEIDRLLFALPPGRLSKVVKGDGLYQIIRVTERLPAGIQPFTAVQNEIKDKIKQQRSEELLAEYLANLRKETYVWTSTGGDAVPAQYAEPAK